MSISKALLEKLACPRCRGPVELVAGDLGLACPSCALFYEICEDIPVMIVELARPLPAG
jgi:uncharacterized protein YbaR (Trm112 family)